MKKWREYDKQIKVINIIDIRERQKFDDPEESMTRMEKEDNEIVKRPLR